MIKKSWKFINVLCEFLVRMHSSIVVELIYEDVGLDLTSWNTCWTPQNILTTICVSLTYIPSILFSVCHHIWTGCFQYDWLKILRILVFSIINFRKITIFNDLRDILFEKSSAIHPFRERRSQCPPTSWCYVNGSEASIR